MTPSDSTAARDDARRLWWSVVGAVGLATLAGAWILTRATPLTLGGDAEMLQHPLLTDAVRQLRDGRLPVWTAGRWGGSPLIGDPVIGALYPPYYLSYLLTPFPHWRALDVSTCLHLTLLLTQSSTPPRNRATTSPPASPCSGEGYNPDITKDLRTTMTEIW